MKAVSAPADGDWRGRVLVDPDMILEDRDVMRALIAANERQMGKNIVDLRGIAMERLEARLDRLEDTHRSVIAAAYENLAGTNQIHRSVLRILDCATFPALLDFLAGELSEILRVDAVRLVLESTEPGEAPHPAVVPVAIGAVEAYVAGGRVAPPRPVTLRQCAPAGDAVFGDRAADLRSEALLQLDLGPGRAAAMLALGGEDPHQFRAGQGTDLLQFLAGCLERTLRRHLGA
ncbi:DUF484 family protein [Jannaschia sp. W003]|uniref:DUF484 family protein n=1 Tax=Jannaschia sp. W003 TaxID=2867012 RepID=UPI0021A44C84|nr:DUF484 family protein [Jannaschia sp. W003]UWQ22608.1 DUF484 family protein [Jannaschia sp. W003]